MIVNNHWHGSHGSQRAVLRCLASHWRASPLSHVGDNADPPQESNIWAKLHFLRRCQAHGTLFIFILWEQRKSITRDLNPVRSWRMQPSHKTQQASISIPSTGIVSLLRWGPPQVSELPPEADAPLLAPQPSHCIMLSHRSSSLPAPSPRLQRPPKASSLFLRWTDVPGRPFISSRRWTNTVSSNSYSAYGDSWSISHARKLKFKEVKLFPAARAVSGRVRTGIHTIDKAGRCPYGTPPADDHDLRWPRPSTPWCWVKAARHWRARTARFHFQVSTVWTLRAFPGWNSGSPHRPAPLARGALPSSSSASLSTEQGKGREDRKQPPAVSQHSHPGLPGAFSLKRPWAARNAMRMTPALDLVITCLGTEFPNRTWDWGGGEVAGEKWLQVEQWRWQWLIFWLGKN